MSKKFLHIVFAMPLIIMLYIPIILLFIEYLRIPYPVYNLFRFSTAFILFYSGIALWIWCYHILKVEGEGTAMPANPTQQLVRIGPYKYVRNPMVISVWAILLGEALYFNSLYLYIWTGLIFVASLIVIPKYEEPYLLKKFGQRYMEYRAEVRRWF